MVEIKMQLSEDAGEYTAIGHCDPQICTVICALEDSLEANLRAHGCYVDGDNEYGERRMEWAGEHTKPLAEYLAVALAELEDSYPEALKLEVEDIEDS